MKTKHLFLGLFAALTFSACSGDDDPANPNNGNEENSDNVAYLAFNIVANNGGGFTRADNEPTSTTTDSKGNDKFENGTGKESTVSSVYCVFYDNAGNFMSAKDVTPTPTFTDQTATTSPQVEKICDATVVLSGKSINASKMIVVLNPTDAVKSALANKTVAQAKEISANYGDDKTNFLMTNSVYNKTTAPSGTVCEVNFDTNNLGTTPEDAKTKAVDVYVERVLAKVVVTFNQDITINSTSGTIYDGTNNQANNITLKPVVVTVKNAYWAGVTNTTESSYLLKNIANLPKSDWTSWNWNDEANKRSYWANNPSNANIDGYHSFQEFQNNNSGATAQASLTSTPVVNYIQENTDITKPTCVIVCAQLTDVATNQPVNLIKQGGRNYTDQGFLQLIKYKFDQKNIKYTSGGQTKAFETTDFKFKQKGSQGNKAFEVEVALADFATTYNNLATGTGYGTANDIKQILDEYNDQCWYWKDGKCYYYVDIEHFGKYTEKATDGTSVTKNLKGIVRNHVYYVDIASISGLGTPVYDPDQPIIPERPEDLNWYLAAKINVLKWKIVHQVVDLK